MSKVAKLSDWRIVPVQSRQTFMSNTIQPPNKQKITSFYFCVCLTALTMSRSLADVASSTEKTTSGRYALSLRFKSQRLVEHRLLKKQPSNG
jgi:hypothetical protein